MLINVTQCIVHTSWPGTRIRLKEITSGLAWAEHMQFADVDVFPCVPHRCWRRVLRTGVSYKELFGTTLTFHYHWRNYNGNTWWVSLCTYSQRTLSFVVMDLGSLILHQLSWRNRCTATYSLPNNVSETTRNEITAWPYTLPFVSGPFYHVNDVSVYLDRQRGGGIPDWKNAFCTCILHFKPGVVRFSLHKILKLQRLRQKL